MTQGKKSSEDERSESPSSASGPSTYADLRAFGTKALHASLEATSRTAKQIGVSRKAKKVVLAEVRRGFVKEFPCLQGSKVAEDARRVVDPKEAAKETRRRALKRENWRATEKDRLKKLKR